MRKKKRGFWRSLNLIFNLMFRADRRFKNPETGLTPFQETFMREREVI